MKTRKVFSFVTAAVMSLASLPVLVVNAAEVKGDIDGDGYVTGHDTAILSRALYLGDLELTKEQALLADLDDNGQVDLTDLEALHQMEQVPIGGFDVKDRMEWNFARHEMVAGLWTMDAPSVTDFYDALKIDSFCKIGYELKICKDEEFPVEDSTSLSNLYYTKDSVLYVREVVYNSLDADADGTVDLMDSYNLILASGRATIGLSIYAQEGRYDLTGIQPGTIYLLMIDANGNVIKHIENGVEIA